MPFDGTTFPRKPEQPRSVPPSDNAVTLLIIAISFVLLVMPVSISGFVDIVRYLQGR